MVGAFLKKHVDFTVFEHKGDQHSRIQESVAG
jgi:hypothetical protein